MEKILTISVAAYNVESYLEKTLNSLCDDRYVDKLEVFVVDDGGKDKSLEIARLYENRYPGTFFAIHKENGGYGSTVNYSIAHATGKYFKLLDGDDWVQQDGLASVIDVLEKCDDDVVVTDFFIGPSDDSLTLVSTRNEHNRVVKVKEYRTDYPYGMWALFYKTNLLKSCKLILPEHSLYTDQFYSTLPFLSAQTMRFINKPVYCYRYGGRDGQSTSKASRIKHAEEMLKICNDIFMLYSEHQNDNNQYLLSRVVRYYIVALRTMLLYPINSDNLKKLKEFEYKAKKNYPDIYHAAENTSMMGRLVTLLRKTQYMAYWAVALVPDSLLNK